MSRFDIPPGTVELHRNSISQFFESVSIPHSVTKVHNAFRYLINLTALSIPPTVEDFGSSIGKLECCSRLVVLDLDCTHLDGQLGLFLVSLKTVTLVNTISLGARVFKNCTALRNVNLPTTTLVEIGDKAFSGCTSLCHFTVPKSVKRIGARIFENCGLVTLWIGMGWDASPFDPTLDKYGAVRGFGAYSWDLVGGNPDVIAISPGVCARFLTETDKSVALYLNRRFWRPGSHRFASTEMRNTVKLILTRWRRFPLPLEMWFLVFSMVENEK
jgi:hypothetical protein